MMSRTKIGLVASLTAAVLFVAPNVGYANTVHYDPALTSVTSNAAAKHLGQVYSVQVSMVDKDGHSFFSGFDLVDQNGVHYSRSSDNMSQGTCTFTGLPAGRYSIQFYYSGYQTQTPQVVVEHDRSVTVRLATDTYTISGQVVDANGQPLTNALILLEDPTNLGGYWPQTDSNGMFNLTGIANGTYTLEVVNGWTPDGQPIITASQDVTVDNGNVALGTLTASN